MLEVRIECYKYALQIKWLHGNLSFSCTYVVAHRWFAFVFGLVSPGKIGIHIVQNSGISFCEFVVLNDGSTI